MDLNNMDKLFEQAQKSNGSNLNLTQEESERFKKAFEDPEFCKLMSDYVADLQNPEYRAETESYISELEGDNKVPAGKELIRPIPGFVAKTYKMVDGKKGDKVFLNIVSSEKIAIPTKVDTTEGQNWSLPYSVGPPHMEHDKSGESATAFDICYHPNALQISNDNKRFKELLVKTAIDGVQEAYRKQQQQVALNPEFHIVKGVKYKQGQVPTMMIDISNRKDTWENSSASNKNETAKKATDSSSTKNVDNVTNPTTDTQNIRNLNTESDSSVISANKPSLHKTVVKTGNNLAIKKGFLNNSSNKPLYPDGSNEGGSIKATEAAMLAAKPLVSELPNDYVPQKSTNASKIQPNDTISNNNVDMKERNTIRKMNTNTVVKPDESLSNVSNESDEKKPKFTMKERGILSMGDFEGVSRSSMVVSSNRPAELVYVFELPKVTKASKINLDISERNVKLTYEDIYEISLKLPFGVYDKKGSAKYDKSLKTLTVTMPVKPSDIQHIDITAKTGELVSSTSETTKNDDDNDVNTPTSDSRPKQSDVKDLKDENVKSAQVHNRWVSSEIADSKNTNDLSKEIAQKAKEALEKHKQDEINRPPQPPQKVASKPTDSINVENKEAFIPSSTFSGAKKGYYFGTGSSGLGYYIDTPKSKNSKQINVSDSKKPATSAPTSDSQDSCLKQHFQQFSFEFRQTKEAIAVLVHVANIIASSVAVHFTEHGFDVAFSSLKDKDSPTQKIERYSMGFVTINKLETGKCTFDVASLNMVIALFKETPSYWREDIVPADYNELEKKVKPSLSQPLTILRLRECSEKVVLEANEKYNLLQGIDGRTADKKESDASTVKKIAKPGQVKETVAATAAPQPANSKNMKFTVGALLDLD